MKWLCTVFSHVDSIFASSSVSHYWAMFLWCHTPNQYCFYIPSLKCFQDASSISTKKTPSKSWCIHIKLNNCLKHSFLHVPAECHREQRECDSREPCCFSLADPRGTLGNEEPLSARGRDRDLIRSWSEGTHKPQLIRERQTPDGPRDSHASTLTLSVCVFLWHTDTHYTHTQIHTYA